MNLELKHVTAEIESKKLIDDVSFKLDSGSWLMMVGPNGAGKSSLVRCLARTIDYKGDITIDGVNIQSFKSREYARIIGFQSQINHITYEFSVEEVVAMGAYSNDKYDPSVLKLADLEHLRNKSVLTLSGGELQRVFLAQLFAQNPDILVLDEPTNNLDIKHQQELFEILGSWIKDRGVSALSIVHDLNIAKKYGDDLLVLNKGKFVDSIDDAFEMDVSAYMQEMGEQWKA
ncbi:MAG: ABC transporter ATP-binding protein [Coriobacteriia bacterium]|nr:ABC transporter ATP-binding protein [Coriobacteriia bacterium]